MQSAVQKIIPRLNGEVPSWANLFITIAGIPLTGCTALEYKTEYEIEEVRGLGGIKQGRGYGAPDDSGSITLLREEVEALRSASETGRLQDIGNFDIIAQFIRAGGSKITTHKLIDCQFKSDGVTIALGDTKNEKQIDLVIGEIKYK